MFNICIVKPKNYIHYQAFTEVAELIHFSLLNLKLKSSISFNHLDTNPKKKILFSAVIYLLMKLLIRYQKIQ